MITTSIVGDLFVIHDPDGDLETVVGGQTTLDWVGVYQLLRGSFGDHYDFLSCYLDVGSGMISIGAASGTIWQDASGIGRWTAANGFNERPAWGTSKLQQYAHFATNLPSTNLSTVLHEIGHRWLAYVNYANTDPGPAQLLLHEDWIWNLPQKGVHWGRWLDNGNSCMDYDQAEWIDNGNGTFNRIDRDPNVPAHDEWFGYCPLDQYLMGLLPPSGVPPFKIVRSPTPAIGEGGPFGVATGPYTPNPGALTVTIDQVRNRRSDEPTPWSGPRNPTHLTSQRVFHEAVVVISKNPGTATGFIAATENLGRRAAANFRRVTYGRALIDASLLRANYGSLYVKDNPADTGTGPSSAPFWVSPDLWVRNADDGGLVNQNTVRGSSNWIYVRVRNRSTQPYANVTVNVYLANFAGTEFLYPVDWKPAGLLGTAQLATVPAAAGGVEGSAIAKVEWTADRIPPAPGWHPCLLCEVIPMEVTPSGLHHVFENRKLAQRNLTIVDPGGAGGGAAGGGFIFSFPFRIGHELRPRGSTVLRVETEARPAGYRIFLDTDGLVDGIAEDAVDLTWNIPLGVAAVPADGAVTAIGPEDSGPREHAGRGRRGGCLGALLRLLVPGGRSRLSAHRPSGLRPVLLNGLPLLEVVDSRASVMLSLPAEQRRTLRLFGVVPEPGIRAVHHVVEESGGRITGGVSVQVGS